MSQRTWIAGLPFANDVVTLLKTNWSKNTGGAQPTMNTSWKVKAVGVADSIAEQIIISIDSENPQIYSMLQSSTATNPSNYDWLHDVSLSVDVRTGKSEERVLQMIGEVVRILETNVVPLINFHQYIRVLPGPIHSANEEYRNLFRYIIDVDGLIFDP